MGVYKGLRKIEDKIMHTDCARSSRSGKIVSKEYIETISTDFRRLALKFEELARTRFRKRRVSCSCSGKNWCIASALPIRRATCLRKIRRRSP